MLNQDISYYRSVIAPSGTLRVAINLGNPVLAQRSEEGELGGASVHLAKRLATALGVETEIITFNAAGKVVEACKDDVWDIAFLARDPKRAESIFFTSPYVIIEGTYLVRSESEFMHVDELDNKGVSISVGKGAAYDLFLTRNLTNAKIVRANTSAAAVDVFVERQLDAAAGVRQPLQKFSNEFDGYRVLSDSFTNIEQAMALPISRKEAGWFMDDFVHSAIKEGFVKDAFYKSGQPDVTIPSSE